MKMFKSTVTGNKNGNEISSQLLTLSTKLYCVSKKVCRKYHQYFICIQFAQLKENLKKHVRAAGHDPALFKEVATAIGTNAVIPFALHLDEMICKAGCQFKPSVVI